MKLFSSGKDEHSPGELIEEVSVLTLKQILELPKMKDVQVLVVDVLTQTGTASGAAGTAAFEWAGMSGRVGGRRVIHVSSLGSFANKQVQRDEACLIDLPMPLFTRNDYIKSLSDADLKKAVCDTLHIDDPKSVSNDDLVDQKFFFSGINARWFYNRSILEIRKEVDEIVGRLNDDVPSTGPKDPRAVNSAKITIVRESRTINVYTSCFLAQSIGSNQGSYHSEFLKLFPFVAHTLGTGEFFESDFQLNLEQSHNLRDTQVAVIGEKAEDVMVCLGKCDDHDNDNSKVLWAAGKINSLPTPPTDQTALQQTSLNPTLVERIPQWFIPKSKTQPFLDVLVLFPATLGKWILGVMQNTIGKTHSADPTQLKRIVGGILLDGFDLEESITVVYIIENRQKKWHDCGQPTRPAY